MSATSPAVGSPLRILRYKHGGNEMDSAEAQRLKEQAAALLAKVTHALPVVPQNELTNSTEFVDALRVPNDSYQLRISREQLLGELGVLSLSRGDFSQALDALLRANFWEDAAYVAERVLTVDELKAYVDREWPTRSAATNAPEAMQFVKRDNRKGWEI